MLGWSFCQIVISFECFFCYQLSDAANCFLLTCHLINLMFCLLGSSYKELCLLAFLSSCHFVYLSFCLLSFCLLVILSTCHFVYLSFCLLVILSTCHFVYLSFCLLVILSTCHFVYLSFCLLVILSTCHFVYLSFCLLLLSYCSYHSKLAAWKSYWRGRLYTVDLLVLTNLDQFLLYVNYYLPFWQINLF